MPSKIYDLMKIFGFFFIKTINNDLRIFFKRLVNIGIRLKTIIIIYDHRLSLLGI